MGKKKKTNTKKIKSFFNRKNSIIWGALSVVCALYFSISPDTIASSSVTEAAIKSALSRYCVPPNGHNCNPNELAHYDSATDSCIPTNEGYFWDAEARISRIEVECPSGYGRYFWPIEDILAYKCPGAGEGLREQEYTLPNN